MPRIAIALLAAVALQSNALTGNGLILGRTVDAGTGRPVAGAIVKLSSPTTGAPAGGGGGRGGPSAPIPGQQSVVTNAEGYFLFRDLPAGRFSIAATALGYMQSGYLQSKPAGAARSLDLAENEKRSGADIRMWKYGSVSGTVVDEAGEPAVGAAVRLHRRTFSVGRALLSANSITAITDDRGVYRAGGLTPGDYVVGIFMTQSTIPASVADGYASAMASAADPSRAPVIAEFRNNRVFSTSNTGVRVGDQILQLPLTSVAYTLPQPAENGRVLSYATTLYRSATTIPEATIVTVGSGEERTGIDLAVRLVPTVRVSGVVMGPDGPVKNMGVNLFAPGSEDSTSGSGTPSATTATDANGGFTLLNVAAGSYVLKAARSSLIRMAAPTEADKMLWASQPITVGDTDIAGIRLTLRPGLTIRGRVEFIGTKPAPTPQEMPRFSIMTVSALTGASLRESMVIVEADGRFVTNGDLPGPYFVMTLNPSGWYLRSVMHQGRNIADEPVDLSSDANDVVATFVDVTSKLSGIVVNANGGPDAQADVIVFPADSDGWRRGVSNSMRMRLAAASETGAYTFPTLPAGQYYVVAVSDSVVGEWRDPKFLQQLVAGATKVTLGDGEAQTVALKTLAIR